MAGNTANAQLWTNADVYIAPVNTDGPTDVTTAWPAGWNAVGLLDGDEGFTMTRDEDSNDYYAWGGILVKSTKSKHKRQVKFSALEDNDTVFELVNPGSTRTTAGGLTTSDVKVPLQTEFAIGFELRDGDTVKRRIVKRASVDSVDDYKEGEADMSVYALTVTLYPDADGVLYRELVGSTSASS